MDFGALAIVVAAGLLGPLLALRHGLGPLLVVGQLLGGIAVGAGGLGWVDATDPGLEALSDVGFALLMLIAGTHLPLRAPGLGAALRDGVLATTIVVALAVPLALLLDGLTTLDAAVLALLLAASSAAVVLPVLAVAGPPGGLATRALAWVVVADVATIVAVPAVLAEGHLAETILGSAAIVLLGALLAVVATRPAVRRLLRRPGHRSLRENWGLRLRLSLLGLFALCWLAVELRSSVLLAGFAIGAVLALAGEPRTVARELIGVGEGFLVPVFFVLLGARLDVGALAEEPELLLLAGALTGGAVAVHVVAARLLRLDWSVGAVAAAQLGVPSAVATLGLRSGVVGAGEAAAIVLAAVASVLVASLAAIRMRRVGGRARTP